MGDLNMNLNRTSNDFNNLFFDFMLNKTITNKEINPTRIATIEKNNIQVHTETLIDVIIHNDDLVSDCQVIDGPKSISDHCFVVTNIKIIKVAHEVKSIIGRNLNKNNLLKIFDQYDYINYSDLYLAANPELKWKIFKDKILHLLN
jgi:hypothetical protein